MWVGEIRTNESREMDGEQVNKRKLGIIKSESWRAGGGKKMSEDVAGE
jgi:hypothetical protein